jgi:hypothetical protein
MHHEVERALHQLIPAAYFKQACQIVDAHRPSDQSLEHIYLRKIWGHQKIMQNLSVIKSQRYLQNEGNKLIDQNLLEELKWQIDQKGGIPAIHIWLCDNDPGYNKEKGIDQQDWSWLWSI